MSYSDSLHRADIGKIQSVSIIIPVYNGQAYLAEAIESALAQDFPAVEIIVVDDGSQDASAQIAAGYEAVTVVRQANRGVAKARNRGFAESTGDAIIFLDQDDRLLPTNVSAALRAFEAAPESGFVVGRARILHEGAAGPGADLPGSEAISYASVLSGQIFIPPSVVMIRRAAFEKTGGFSAGYRGTDDLDMYLNLARFFPAHAYDEVVVEYRRHDHNVSHDVGLMLRECLRVLDDHRRFVDGDAQLEAALAQGRKHWSRFFGRMLPGQMLRSLTRAQFAAALQVCMTTVAHYPYGFVEFFLNRLRRHT